MDPVSALGVAAATVQFISFAGDVLSKSREIYLSADGTLLAQTELDTIAKSLRSLCAPFKYWDPRNGKRRALNVTEVQLMSLCKGCVKVSEELEKALAKLKVRGDNQHWKSFRQALNTIRSEDEIEQLCTRMDRYRNQITTLLLFIVRQKIDQIEEKTTVSAEEISQLLLGTVKENRQWQAELVKSIHEQKWNSESHSNVEDFASLFIQLSEDQREKFIEADILRRLHFQTMHDRQERIPEAFMDTFEWVFDPAAAVTGEQTFDSYVDWLQNGDSVYWITGKPGAGKSTLMKYLHNDPRTKQHVSSWVGGADLVTAGFFFWNSGTEMQMSGEGLLQTLLYQVTQANRSLVPQIFHESWRNYELFGGDIHDKWRWPELAKAFKALLSNDERKFLFFVDGLDEFSGDHSELVSFLLEISKFTNVKLCVSSRPWLAFEEAFGKRPRLRIETLTRSDIHLFVSERLRMNQRFRDLELNEQSDAQLLIDEVTGKAHGVFLWVYLVVRSLQEGLRDGDSMKDLLARIASLPSDLEELFRKILDRLDTSYFEQASILFQLMAAAAPRPLSVLSFAFAEDGFEKAMTATIEPLNQGQLSSRAESIRRRLNSRSKGLLEATPVKQHPERAHVQYLHRTVKDFLARQDIWTYIVSGTDASFDASVTLCGTYLLQLKTLEASETSSATAWDAIRGCMDHACRAEDVLDGRQIKLLDEMDRAARKISKRGAFGRTDCHWADTIVRHLEDDADCRSFILSYPCESFFEYATNRKLYHYLEEKIASKEASSNQIVKGRTLLYLATRGRDVRLINFLLEQKADPNKTSSNGTSAWQHLLQLLDSSYCQEPEVWYELVTLFLDHGANPEAIANSRPAFEIIEMAFGGWDFEQTKRVLQKMLSMRKALKKRSDWPKALLRRESSRYVQLQATLIPSIVAHPLPEWATMNRTDTGY